jgi:hypothetical protein
LINYLDITIRRTHSFWRIYHYHGCSLSELFLGRYEMQEPLFKKVYQPGAVSRASALRIRTPFSAPLPVPTIIAVGVANPRAQGQAIMTTAMNAVRPKTNPDPDAYQARREITPMAKTAGTK